MISKIKLVIVFCIFVVIGGTNVVRVKVESGWSRDESSTLREAIEFVAKAKPESLFEALYLSDVDEIREKIFVDSPLMGKMLDLSLRTGTYMPAVQFYADVASESRARLCPESSSWIETGSGKGICLPESFSLKEEEEEEVQSVNHDKKILLFDHQYDEEDGKPLMILYGTPGTSSFLSFHKILMSMTSEIRYVFRQAPLVSPLSTNSTSTIRGWGVSMDIKNMEYKALDDRPLSTLSTDDDDDENKDHSIQEDKEADELFDEEIEGFLFQTLQKRYPQHRDSMENLRQELLEQIAESASEIRVWEMQDIELQATQHILNAKKRLDRLQHVSQNFPSHAKALTRLEIDENLSNNVKQTQQQLGLQPGQNIFRVNGLDFDINDEAFDMHGFLSDMVSEIDRAQVRAEFQKRVGSDIMESLDGVGIEMAKSMQKSKLKAFSSLHPLTFTHTHTHTLQTDTRLDFRKDAKGKIIFLNNLQKDKRYKGWSKSLRTIMRPSYGLPRVARSLYTLVVVLDPTTLQGQETINALFEIVEKDFPVRVGVVFSSSSSSSKKHLEIAALAHLLRYKGKKKETCNAFLRRLSPDKDLTKIVQDVVSSSIFGSGDLSKTDISEALENDSEHMKFALNSETYARERGLSSPAFVFNGRLKLDPEEDLESWITTSLRKDMSIYQRVIFQRQMSLKEKNPIKFLMKEDQLISRYSSTLNSLFLSEKPLFMSADKLKEVSDWTYGTVAEDSSSIVGSRVSIIVSEDKKKEEQDLVMIKESSKHLPKSTRIATISSSFLPSSLSKKKNVVIVNGWVLNSNDPIEIKDLITLDKIERSIRADHVSKLYNNNDDDDDDFFMSLCTYVGMSTLKSRKSSLSDHGPLTFHQGITPFKDAILRVRVVVSPASEAAQRVSPILNLLSSSFKGYVSVMTTLNPRLQVDELPLKRYYRLTTVENESLFETLPRRSVMTMKIETPMPWIVQASNSDLDLDNLKLEGLSSGSDVYVAFELKRLLVAGHCMDKTNHLPPNGLQLELSSSVRKEVFTDTLVMRNLGYFQMQANPGLWNVNIAPGRGTELFTIHEEEDKGNDGKDYIQIAVRDFSGGDGASGSGDGTFLVVVVFLFFFSRFSCVCVYLNTYTQTLIYTPTSGTHLNVESRPGMEKENLLSEGYDKKSKGGWISNIWSSKSTGGDDKEEDIVHVFSLATGHLYERLMRIMMLSVVKRTSVRVKFWLLENFLSPSFKDWIPEMARHYDFDVEFVTYKWPTWLRRQTEKQRIIWGYKILFLDVLFPLDVKKIIYIDADQVVRADVKELRDLDLKGHAYAYTPFCKSNKETLGFQFWNNKDGFWQKHLRGKPYHISALYVVDLEMFRKRAVGDTLRAVYDQLSADPNSLSNLDQDLPNYVQHQVPIFSLPQEWLWCESWCDQESKSRAKTIDLCNNPLRKEWKLDMAKRVISGDLFQESWIELDDEIRNLYVSFEESKNTETHKVSHDDL